MASLIELMKEDSPLQPTAESTKQGWWFLAGVLIGCTICVPVFVMGADLAHQLPLPSFIMATILGGMLAATIALATGIVGQRTGLPTAMLAKVAFGQVGHVLANAAMALCAIGWFGIQTSVFSQAFVQLADQVWNWSLNEKVVMVVAGLVMSSTAIIGYRGLGKLSYIAVPLLIVLLLLPLYVYYVGGQLGTIGGHPIEKAVGFGTVVALVGGAYSFAATMPDVTRFMRSNFATTTGIVANFVFAYPLLLILTGSVALAAGQNDYMQIMLGLGYGTLAIWVLFLATWTTNDTNVYCAALSANMFLPRIPRWQIALGVGVVGTVFSLFGIFEHFMSWLIFTGNLFAPMAGVYVADYWLNRDRYKKFDNIPMVRYPELAAWGIGLLVGLATTTKDNMGLEIFTLTTVPMVDALAAAALVKLLYHRFCASHMAPPSCPNESGPNARI